MAYQLLHGAAKKRTEHFVIEAGVDTDATFKADLPPELLNIVQRTVNPNYEYSSAYQDSVQDTFGYLLGWMVVFDLFVDAVCADSSILFGISAEVKDSL